MAMPISAEAKEDLKEMVQTQFSLLAADKPAII